MFCMIRWTQPGHEKAYALDTYCIMFLSCIPNSPEARGSKNFSGQKLRWPQTDCITWPCSPCYSMPPLRLSTPGDITSNSFYPIAAKTCINTLFFQSRSERGMPYHRRRWGLIPWTSSRPASQVLRTNAAPNCFYPALSGSVIVNCTFFLIIFFFGHHVSSSVLTARDYWKIEIDRDRFDGSLDSSVTNSFTTSSFWNAKLECLPIQQSFIVRRSTTLFINPSSRCSTRCEREISAKRRSRSAENPSTILLVSTSGHLHFSSASF